MSHLSSKAAARAAGHVRYQGAPCKRGHAGIRYVSTGNCVECARMHAVAKDRDKSDLVGQSKRVFRSRRAKARAAGVGFTIEFEDVGPAPSRCPVLLTPMSWNGDRESSPSLDRLDPTKGYVKGNVRWVSFRANRIKNNASPEELRLVADFYSQS